MMMIWWWLDVWAHWFALLEIAIPPPPLAPPPDGGTVVNMADWRRSHPDHNGWAA